MSLTGSPPFVLFPLRSSSPPSEQRREHTEMFCAAATSPARGVAAIGRKPCRHKAFRRLRYSCQISQMSPPGHAERPNPSARGTPDRVDIRQTRLHSSDVHLSPDGLWRSLAARLTGGQEVAGSNPASPTNESPAPAGVSYFTGSAGSAIRPLFGQWFRPVPPPKRGGNGEPVNTPPIPHQFPEREPVISLSPQGFSAVNDPTDSPRREPVETVTSSRSREPVTPPQSPTLEESARALIAAYLNRIEATSITYAKGTPT